MSDRSQPQAGRSSSHLHGPRTGNAQSHSPSSSRNQ
jgi:hypothetical protein